MTDPQTPATEAGRAVVGAILDGSLVGQSLDAVRSVILAIEAEARADALREAAERVRAQMANQSPRDDRYALGAQDAYSVTLAILEQRDDGNGVPLSWPNEVSD